MCLPCPQKTSWASLDELQRPLPRDSYKEQVFLPEGVAPNKKQGP